MNNYMNTEYTRSELITLALKIALQKANEWKAAAINDGDTEATEHYHGIESAFKAMIEETAQQPTETENAPQAATQQADDITAAIIDSMTAPAPAQTITVTWANGTRATYSANMLDLLRTDPAAIDIQDDETGEIVYIKP